MDSGPVDPALARPPGPLWRSSAGATGTSSPSTRRRSRTRSACFISPRSMSWWTRSPGWPSAARRCSASAGALGVALAARQAQEQHWDEARLAAAVKRIADARPTAVNLRREAEAAAAVIPDGAAAVEQAALATMAATVDRDPPDERARGPLPAAGVRRRTAADRDPLQHRGAGVRGVGHHARRGAVAAPERGWSGSCSPTRRDHCSRAPVWPAFELGEMGACPTASWWRTGRARASSPGASWT